MRPGWFVGGPENVTASEFVAIKQGVEINDAALSPDGARVAFVSNPGDSEPDTVWLARSDGSDPRRIDSDGVKGDAFFAPDGDLWWIENDGNAARLQHRSSGRTIVRTLDEAFRWSFVGWLDRGLALAGNGPDRDRLLVIDPQSFEEVALHDARGAFTVFLGMARVAVPSA